MQKAREMAHLNTGISRHDSGELEAAIRRITDYSVHPVSVATIQESLRRHSSSSVTIFPWLYQSPRFRRA